MPIISEEPSQILDAQGVPIARRNVLGMIGMAGLGLVASSASVSAFTFGQPKVTVGSSTPATITTPTQSAPISSGVVDVSGLPQEWLIKQGPLVQEYARYLNTLKFKNLTTRQVIEAHAKEKGGVWNNLPPKQWWTRMGYTLRVVDRIAVELKSPVEEIVSAYRCPIYNAHCEGAKVGSWHQANVAVDVRFPMSAYKVTAVSRNLRDRGLFKGGVGSYPNFTHVDTRGTNINWG